MNSEFRQDLVSGEWVIISPKRFKKPQQFAKKIKRKIVSPKGCPFEDPQKTGHKEPILIYPDFKKWLIQLIPNKFPILEHKNICFNKFKKGLYLKVEGSGYHDLVITKNHYKNFANLDKKTTEALFEIFKKRFDIVSKDKCVKYCFIFHNWGPKAGASIFHPHYQILSLPIIPPVVSRSLDGAEKYFKKNKKCTHCAIIKYEKKIKKRVIYENKEAIVFSPFAAKEPFELRIYPKKHFSLINKTPDNVIKQVAEALQKSLIKIEKKLDDPDYNFFINVAPFNRRKNYDFYHWHIEVQPKFSISAGVEIGTGIEVTIVDPNDAAKILKN